MPGPPPFPPEVAAWNATGRPFPSDSTLSELLDAAAARHPDAPALRDPAGAVVTHAELARQAADCAGRLSGAGVGPGTAVAILSDHDFAAVTAIVAIERAGGFYVPLETRWPVHRCAEIMRSLGIRYLVIGPGLERTAFEVGASIPGLAMVLMTPGNQPGPEPGPSQAVAELWDGIAASADPAEAAGFNLGRGEERFDLAAVAAYASHVAGLAMSAYRPGSALLEIGAGSGLITRALAPRVSRLVAIDPAAAAMGRLAEEMAGAGLTASAGFAHEAAAHIKSAGDVSVVVLASTVQYFPSVCYLRAVLSATLPTLGHGASVVIADLIDPLSGQFPGSLRVPRSWWEDYGRSCPGVQVQVQDRDGTALAAPLKARYDVVLTVTDPARAAPEGPRPAAELPAAWSALPPAPVAGPSATDLAYTITTSGSTGPPKAVAVRHRSVVNLIDWFNRRNDVSPADVILQAAAFSFDLSVYDIFGVLAAGGSLLMLPERQLAEPAAVAEALIRCQVTLWNSAPAAFTALLPFLRLRPPAGRDTLRRVFLSGDWVPLSTLADLNREFPRATLVALGGATEACVWSNDFVVTELDPSWESIPYGNPMQNARYYVLDENRTPCLIGQPGELYIAGECVAAGYLNDPQLSAARFQPDPWDEGRSVMYRTGDRARWTRHGWIEFLGRLDQQVKVRGYRIELGEVEQAAQRLPGVDEAVAVTYGEPRDPQLGLVVRMARAADWRGVRDQLRAYLPAYMMPARVRVVPTLPVSGTGKVDRAAVGRLLTADSSAPAATRPIRVLGTGTGR